jgi:chromosomal replication initiation ATPase DnaA
MAIMRTDAERGSSKLLLALMRMDSRRRKPPKPRHSRTPYGTTEDRRQARSQIERLQREVANFYGIKFEALTGRRGPTDVSEKRQVAMYLARKIIQASFPEIAKSFHRNNHTTVIHACRVVESRPHLAADASELRRRIGA